MASTAIQSRGRVMGSLTIIRKFLGSVNQNTTCADIEVRLNKIDALWNEFQQFEDQIVVMAANNPNANIELKQEEFENSFFDTKSKLLELMRKKQSKDTVAQATNTGSFDQLLDQQRVFLENLADRTQAINERSAVHSSDNLKLPRVRIDQFSGEYEAWPSFYDLYLTSVHNVDTISNVHKFQILKGSLNGPPLNLIRNFLVTDANYEEAWDKLVKRYNKTRPILNSYIDRFFDQPSASNGSPQSLRQISDKSDEIIRGIKALGVEAETRDPWLIRILLNKVDEETRVAWANATLTQEFPKINDFLEFLNDRCYAKESAVCDSKKKVSKIPSVVVKTVQVAPTIETCPCCKRQHNLRRCFKFKTMSVIKRRSMVNTYGVCYNCLREGHSASSCPVEYSCRVCNLRHNTMLHLESESTKSNQTTPISSVAQIDIVSKDEQQEASNPTTSSQVNSNMVTTSLNAITLRLALLPTALIYLRDSSGKTHTVRALLDSGSQSTFISESLVQRLDLKRSFANVRVSGISETRAELVKGLIKIRIHSRFDQNEVFNVEALILPKLTSTIPRSKIDASYVEELRNYDLQYADPTFHEPSKIDLLLGADIFFDVLKPDKIKIKNQITAQSTKFGWVVSGTVIEPRTDVNSLSAIIEEIDISKALENFWTIEEVPTAAKITEAEANCDRHFVETYKRKSNGRYVVKLPFTTDSKELGYSKLAAANRLTAMERKFDKDSTLREDYVKFMEEYLSLGHMREIETNEVNVNVHKCFYLPHHAVVKLDSTTTKLRVVFDGSCKSASGVSLNDKLLVGPTIQKDLTSILMLFRKHAFVFSADVEKMYRQIEVDYTDQDYQRVIWRKTASEPMKEFRLTTVTYGTSCAPFLAVRTLHQIANDDQSTFPVGSIIAKRDFYVDDCLSGGSSIEEARIGMVEVSEMLQRAGLNLRKWKSNSSALISTIHVADRDNENLHINDESGTVKTLGLLWNQTRDPFSYKIKLDSKKVSSKREMLSQISRIFDPLGWVSPVIIVFKIHLQKLWLRNLSWDEPLPQDIEQQWLANQSSLMHLQDIEVPRFLMIRNTTIKLQIHGFCDASENAYAAITYVRTTDKNGSSTTRIAIAKTKVAPLKQVSLPRLELCGAVLLSRLIQYTKKSLEVDDVECYAWTDSKIVLSWLSDVPRRWKCFVGNRTSEILERIPRKSWNYVMSKDNPADIASRGVNPKQLVNNSLWWNGPAWLIDSMENWPSNIEIEDTKLESRTISLMTHSKSNVRQVIEDLVTRIESFAKIKRIIAMILKLHKNYRELDIVDRLKKAEILCVKWAQSEEFEEEINSLKQTKKIGTTSKILSLFPFLDTEGVLRVGGRLENLDASFDVKHPIILPKKHLLNDRIIRETHLRYLHPGPTLQISLLRQRYWIISCRNSVKNHINKCVECRRQKAATSQQLMGNLPRTRITPSRPFLYTGVDYAGPLYLKTRMGKGRIPIVKGYICIFICFATKAIHIEVCYDMTAEAFIAALRRFISRRGIPIEIMSDNGSNFVGAKRKLEELHQLYHQNHNNKLISNFLSQQHIKFVFNPANGPHFGGIWESGVKSIKYHLIRVTKDTMVTSTEMETLLVQIEGLLNSRPLCPMTDDIDDLVALTPAHFLIGEPITAIPEPPLEDIPMNRLSRWQNVQTRVQSFWRKWTVNYLHTLQQRRKWNEREQNIKIGELVIIKEDNLPPSKWLMGRVITIHPGTDGLVRVVSIKTTTGILKRPIVKVCRLLSDDETTSTANNFSVLKPGILIVRENVHATDPEFTPNLK